MTTPPAPRDPNYERLDQRVNAIESSLEKIGGLISNLGEKFENRSRPQWLLILGALGLVVTILGIVLTGWKAPIDSTIQRQEYDVRQLQQSLVPRVEHEGQWSALQRENNDFKRRLDRLEDGVFVPRK